MKIFINRYFVYLGIYLWKELFDKITENTLIYQSPDNLPKTSHWLVLQKLRNAGSWNSSQKQHLQTINIDSPIMLTTKFD